MERLRDAGGQAEWRCANCSAELAQEYCSRCGQRRIHPQDLSACYFLRELAGKIANLQAQFKTLRTLRGLLIPGWLTAEYLAGRRQLYRSPFKVYLVCAAIFFVLAPVAGFKLASMLDSDSSGALSRLVSARLAERALDLPLFNARFDVRVQPVYTATLGAVAIAFALMLQLLFGKEDKPYGAHLTFALHYISFMYLVTIAAGASRTIGVSMGTAAIAGYALLVPYLSAQAGLCGTNRRDLVEGGRPAPSYLRLQQRCSLRGDPAYPGARLRAGPSRNSTRRNDCREI